jgi:hypothetical protein
VTDPALLAIEGSDPQFAFPADDTVDIRIGDVTL